MSGQRGRIRAPWVPTIITRFFTGLTHLFKKCIIVCCITEFFTTYLAVDRFMATHFGGNYQLIVRLLIHSPLVEVGRYLNVTTGLLTAVRQNICFIVQYIVIFNLTYVTPRAPGYNTWRATVFYMWCAPIPFFGC